MNYTLLDEKEMETTTVGAVTLAAILAVLASAVIAVVVYRLFMSKKGSASLGGWKFTWN